MNCKTCFYSRDIENDTAVACHRYPPTITGAQGAVVTTYFPLLSNTSWCGEWRVKEPSLLKIHRGGASTATKRKPAA